MYVLCLATVLIRERTRIEDECFQWCIDKCMRLLMYVYTLYMPSPSGSVVAHVRKHWWLKTVLYKLQNMLMWFVIHTD